MPSTRLGVFGATFNPPTFGHKDAVDQSLEEFDQVLLLPNASHAFGKPMAPFFHRIGMLQLFVRMFPQKRVLIDLIEEDLLALQPKGPIYTFDVLQALEKKYLNMELSFIIGPDNLKNWESFYRSEDIVHHWPLFLVQERVVIRSSAVRLMIAQTKDLKNLEKNLEPLVGKEIAEYILKHHLYS